MEGMKKMPKGMPKPPKMSEPKKMPMMDHGKEAARLMKEMNKGMGGGMKGGKMGGM